MEIRCAKCEHVGPAAVMPSDGGVVLVCENCGHHNPLDVPTPSAVGAAPRAANGRALTRGGGGDWTTEAPEPARPPAADISQDSAWLSRAAMEKLIPQPGPGPRCRKCAQLLGDQENCPRCGLNATEGSRFPEGRAPWELPPPGQEAAFDQASLLWKVVDESPTDENLEKFVSFAREEELLEYGIRMLRFFLVDNPDHDGARGHLEQLAQSFQAKMIVARAQAEVRAGNIAETTSRLKNILLAVVFVIWAGIFLVFLSQLAGPGC